MTSLPKAVLYVVGGVVLAGIVLLAATCENQSRRRASSTQPEHKHYISLPSDADPVAFCRLVEELVTSCDMDIGVSGKSAVVIEMPISTIEAAAAQSQCRKFAQQAHDGGFTELRRRGWELRLVSPYAGGNNRAKCPF